MIKPNIGFYLPPLPKKLKKKNDNKKYGYLLSGYYEKELPIIENNGFNLVIIPYNISFSLIPKYLDSIDGIIICGNHKGNHNNDKDHKEHYEKLIKIYSYILNINRERPFPFLAHCYGYELIIKIIENKKYMDEDLLTDLRISEDYFYKKSYFLDDLYQNFINEYSLTIGFLLKDLKNTKNIKKKYNIVSLLEINKGNYMIDVIKHKSYPIFIHKSAPFRDNKKITEDFFYFANLSYQYRKKHNLYSKLPNVKYKTVIYPGKHEYSHIGENGDLIASVRYCDILGNDIVVENPFKPLEKVRLYEY